LLRRSSVVARNRTGQGKKAGKAKGKPVISETVSEKAEARRHETNGKPGVPGGGEPDVGEPAISETVSEKPEAPRRGRPPVMDPEWVKETGWIFSAIKTQRGLHNYWYGQRAAKLLRKHHPRYSWLVGTEEESRDGVRPDRLTILAELGRIEDDESLLLVAGDICCRKPTAAEATRLIRHYRLDRKPGNAVKEVTGIVCKAVNSYLRCHPTVTHNEAFMALENTVLEFMPVQRDVDEV
jgi:hypothetical protein